MTVSREDAQRAARKAAEARKTAPPAGVVMPPMDPAGARRKREQEMQAKPNGATSWPDPLDIIGAPELVGWPELTAECLPAGLYRYVMAEAERLNVDPCPLSGHVLAACAASISDAWRIKPKRHDHWTQQARIWTCVVKEVGARGTEMIRAAFWPVRKSEDELYGQWRQEYAAWEERQGGKKKEKSKDDDPPPVLQRLTTQDATIEATSEILARGAENSKLTILCDEVVSFLGGFNRYSPNGAAGRALWLESYDGGPQRIDRIKRGNIYVPNWSIIVAGNIQPRRLAGMAKDLIDDGLFQRFMTIHTKPALLGGDDDAPLMAGIGADYRDLLTDLANFDPVLGAEKETKPAYFDDGARAVRQAFIPLIERLQVDPTFPTIIRETAPKWSGLLARLSLIFHLVDLAERRRAGEVLAERDLCRVTGPTVTVAATFLRRIALPNLFRLGFETMPEEGAPSGHARWLAGHILAHQAETITAREIGRAYRPLRGKPAETDQAMAILGDAGWAVPADGRSDGAKWAINPGVHALFAKAAAVEKDRRARVVQAIKRDVATL